MTRRLLCPPAARLRQGEAPPVTVMEPPTSPVRPLPALGARYGTGSVCAGVFKLASPDGSRVVFEVTDSSINASNQLLHPTAKESLRSRRWHRLQAPRLRAARTAPSGVRAHPTDLPGSTTPSQLSSDGPEIRYGFGRAADGLHRADLRAGSRRWGAPPITRHLRSHAGYARHRFVTMDHRLQLCERDGSNPAEDRWSGASRWTAACLSVKVLGATSWLGLLSRARAGLGPDTDRRWRRGLQFRRHQPDPAHQLGRRDA